MTDTTFHRIPQCLRKMLERNSIFFKVNRTMLQKHTRFPTLGTPGYFLSFSASGAANQIIRHLRRKTLGGTCVISYFFLRLQIYYPLSLWGILQPFLGEI